MGYSLKQTSFAGGVLSPQILSRSDQAKYAGGLRYMVNCLVRRYGSAENRPGTVFIDTQTQLANGGLWSSGVTYFPGNAVYSAGIHYVALAQTTNQTPASNPTVWQVTVGYAPVRLIKFVFNTNFAYTLVFLQNAIRVYKNGAQVLVPASAIPVWSNATAYLVGNLVSYGGFNWICQKPNTNVIPGAGGSDQQWLVQNAFGSAVPLVIPVNYTTNTSFLCMPQASLAVLQAVNLNDVMTVTSQFFQPFQLTRYSDYAWTVTPYVTATNLDAPVTVTAIPGIGASPTIANPTAVTATGGDATVPTPSWYVVTACDATGESVGSTVVQTSSMGAATVALPVTVAWTPPAGSPFVYFIYAGDTGPYGLVGVTSANSFVDTGIATPAIPAKEPPAVPTGSTVFTYVVTAISSADGSESLASVSASCTGATPTQTAPNVISWSAVTGASSYNVYRILNGIPGLVGTTTLTTFNDTNIQPLFSDQPPVPINNPDGSQLFTTVGNFPAACAYYQQRLCFASTINLPTTVWMSRVGSFANMTVNTPVQDAGSIEFVVASDEAQPVIAMTDLQKFIIHTGSAQYACTGNQAGTITPTAINLIRQGSCGAALPLPVTLGNTQVFVQARGNILRDFRFEIASYTYTGKDLTIFSPELFQGLTVVDMAWQQIKDSIIWVVMSNGQLYGLTYIAEQGVWAWHPHSFTNGFVESVVVVPSASADVVYLSIRRVINGQTVRYLEQLTSRDYSDTVFFSDFNGTDCGLTYNGTVTDGATMTATTGGTWTPSDLITLTSSTNHFLNTDPTNKNTVILSLTDPVTGLVIDRVTFSILNYISATQVQGYPQRVVPTWAQSAVTNWGIGRTTFTGISQLAGQAISVLADGGVVASPLNLYGGPQANQPAYPTITVSNGGGFSIPTAALVVTAGLPIQTDVQGMPLENQQGETILNKHQIIKEVCPIFYLSRDGLYGQDQFHLKPWKAPRGGNSTLSNWGQPPAPYTGPARINVQGTSEVTGQFWARVVDPLPWAMSGIIVSTEVGDM